MRGDAQAAGAEVKLKASKSVMIYFYEHFYRAPIHAFFKTPFFSIKSQSGLYRQKNEGNFPFMLAIQIFNKIIF